LEVVLGDAFAAFAFATPAPFGGKAFDQLNAIAIQERLASGFVCQPPGTTT